MRQEVIHSYERTLAQSTVYYDTEKKHFITSVGDVLTIKELLELIHYADIEFQEDCFVEYDIIEKGIIEIVKSGKYE